MDATRQAHVSAASAWFLRQYGVSTTLTRHLAWRAALRATDDGRRPFVFTYLPAAPDAERSALERERREHRLARRGRRRGDPT